MLQAQPLISTDKSEILMSEKIINIDTIEYEVFFESTILSVPKILLLDINGLSYSENIVTIPKELYIKFSYFGFPSETRLLYLDSLSKIRNFDLK